MNKPCLPLPSRRRKRPAVGSSEKDGNISNTVPMEMEISSLENMDAMAYLSSVKQQATSLPDIFISKESSHENSQLKEERIRTKLNCYSIIDGSAAARDYLLSHRLDILPPPTTWHTITDDDGQRQLWVNSTLDNFSRMRTYLHNCRQALKKCVRVPVPPSKDDQAWLMFCLGDHSAKKDANDCNTMICKSDGDKDNQSNEKDYDIRTKYNISETGYEPTTKLMSQFDQIIIRRLLSHFVIHLQEREIITPTIHHEGKVYKWIYGLLARLEKPIHRDEQSSLMELLRILSRSRASIRANDDGDDIATSREYSLVKMMNVLVILIGIYFEQCVHIDRLMSPIQRE
mmetsp:Transcript_20434/g.31012  ORF Transcript_20434/g.31012 Transcript_20434/m.31012 type:complete len:344 (-) Transcript_20434:282-1313(-)